MKDGVQLEEQLDAVLGIQDVSAVRKTQEGRSWEGENLIISAQVKLCLSQSHSAVAQDFPTFPVKGSWPESCFPMFPSINYSVDVHLSLSYCFEQLQYHLLLSPKPLQTWSQICICLHMHKYYTTFHSHAAVVRNLLKPILHCAFWMVSILVAPYCYVMLSKANISLCPQHKRKVLAIYL